MISECEKCEGTGAIAYEYAAHSLSESPSIGVDECPECDGEGYVCQSCGGVASSEDDDRHTDCDEDPDHG